MQAKKRRANTTTVTTNKGGTAVTTSSVVPQKRKPAAGGTSRAADRAALLARIRLAYWMLTPAARKAFLLLARALPNNQVITKTGVKLKINSWLLYSMLNQAAYYSGAANSVNEAATRPAFPGPIPGTLKLVSSYNTQGHWSLRLTGGTVDDSVAVALAAPVTDGTIYRADAFLQALPLPGGVPIGGVDLTAAFLSVYPLPPLAGEQVGALLTAVNAQGFSSAKVTLPAVTTSGLTEAGDTDGDTALHAA